MNISYVRFRWKGDLNVFDEFFENVLNPSSLVNENQCFTRVINWCSSFPCIWVIGFDIQRTLTTAGFTIHAGVRLSNARYPGCCTHAA